MRLRLFGDRGPSRREPKDLVHGALSVEESRDRIQRLELLQEVIEEMRLAAIDHIDDQDEDSRRRFERAEGAAHCRADATGDPEIRSKALHAVHESGRVLNPSEAAVAGDARRALVDEISAAIQSAQAAIVTRLRAFYYGESAEE